MHRSFGIREDMIACLRTRILGGTYKVEAEQVAEKIMQHGIHVLRATVESERRPL